MEKCKDCKYYHDENTYKGTGFCTLEDDFVKEDDSCEVFEELSN